MPQPTVNLENFVSANQWDLNLQIVPPPQSKSVGFRFSPAFPAQSWNTKWKVLSWVSQKTSLGTKTKISFSFQHCPHTILKSVLAYNLNATKRNHTRWPKNAGFSSFWSIWSKHPLKHQLGHPPRTQLLECVRSVDGVHAEAVSTVSMLRSNYPSSAVGGWWGRKGARREILENKWHGGGTEQPCCQSLMLDTCARITDGYFEVLWDISRYIEVLLGTLRYFEVLWGTSRYSRAWHVAGPANLWCWTPGGRRWNASLLVGEVVSCPGQKIFRGVTNVFLGKPPSLPPPHLTHLLQVPPLLVLLLPFPFSFLSVGPG